MTGSSYSMVPLADFSRVQSGYAFKSADWQPSGIPVVQIGNVRPRTIELDGCKFVTEQVAAQAARFRLRRDDILISMTGHIGVVGRVKLDAHMMLNQRVGRFEHINVRLVDPSYLFQVLQSEDVRHKLVKLGYGAAQPNISPKLIGSVEVPIPPIEIQRRIASILGAYDDLIEVNRSRVALLEKMARGLFEEWFVRFRFPGHEAIGMVETPDGPLPEGWRRAAIGETFDGLYDGPHATPPLSDDGPVFLGIGNITETGQLNLGAIRHISEDDFGSWTKRVTPAEGDIVFTYEATLNRYALIPKGFRGCLGRRLALIRSRSTPGMNRFLFLSFFTAEWRSVVAKNTLSGATVDRIPLKRFPEFPITLPPQFLIEAFDRVAHPLLALKEDLTSTNDRLAASRDLLLPRLISGKLSATQAERELEAAA